MSPFDLESREIGGDCVEVVLAGGVGPAAVGRLETAFVASLEEKRHVLLSLQACTYLDPEVLDAIEAGRERLAGEGLDVLTFGASGALRALLRSTADTELERAALRAREPTIRRLSPRPSTTR